MSTKEKIIKKATVICAVQGFEGLSMRELAKKADIASSVLYHYFKNKDALLKEMFDSINTSLGVKRAALPELSNTRDLLKQRIIFQFDNAAEIVTVLKYYLHNRKDFKKTESGYVPEKAYLHIEEVLHYGVKNGDFADINIASQAKVITHAVNGFILEYFPATLTSDEKNTLVSEITDFIWRGIIKKDENKSSTR